MNSNTWSIASYRTETVMTGQPHFYQRSSAFLAAKLVPVISTVKAMKASNGSNELAVIFFRIFI